MVVANFLSLPLTKGPSGPFIIARFYTAPELPTLACFISFTAGMTKTQRPVSAYTLFFEFFAYFKIFLQSAYAHN